MIGGPNACMRGSTSFQDQQFDELCRCGRNPWLCTFIKYESISASSWSADRGFSSRPRPRPRPPPPPLPLPRPPLPPSRPPDCFATPPVCPPLPRPPVCRRPSPRAISVKPIERLRHQETGFATLVVEHGADQRQSCKQTLMQVWKLQVQQGLKHAPHRLAVKLQENSESPLISAACTASASAIAFPIIQDRIDRPKRPPPICCACDARRTGPSQPQLAARSWASTWAPATPPSRWSKTAGFRYCQTSRAAASRRRWCHTRR